MSDPATIVREAKKAGHIPPPEPPSYPEHDKLIALAGQNNTVGEFLDWLEDEKEFILSTTDTHGRLIPVDIRATTLIAEFFEIDEEELEREKMHMINRLRSLSARD